MRAGGEAGTSAVELVLLTPMLFVAVFLIVQVGLVYHARHVALAAAREGARIARAADTTAPTTDARTGALSYLARIGPQLISHPTVAVTRTASTATVTVTGRAVSILPFIPLTVTERAEGSVEVFRGDR